MTALLIILLDVSGGEAGKALAPTEFIEVTVAEMERNTVATDDGQWQKFEQWVFWGRDGHVLDWCYIKDEHEFRKLDGYWIVTIKREDLGVVYSIKSKKFKMVVGPDTEVADSLILKRGRRKGIFRSPEFILPR